jgi:DNA-binding NarL/FixJ family response regulator
MKEISQLTPRQQQVLELMCQGLPCRAMAERLHLSPHTVGEYRALILRLMDVRNVVELVNKVNALKSEQTLNTQPDLKTALEIPPELIVVEDDPGYRDLVVSGLLKAGFPCRGAGSGSELDSLLAARPAEIVVLDLNLGDEDGLTIARTLRETGPCGIIMMTTRGSIQNRIDGLAMGTDAYLVKPVDMRELIGVIRNLHRRLVEWRLQPAA